jgi:hypothetical protein
MHPAPEAAFRLLFFLSAGSFGQKLRWKASGKSPHTGKMISLLLLSGLNINNDTNIDLKLM